jgi:NitT/TauT family transport system substrate-binding protein
MRRSFLRAISLTCVALIVMLSAGCGSSSSSTPTGLEKTTLTVGAVPVADEAGLFIAEDEGLFRDEGLNVKIDPIVSSALATQDQNNGTYDITAGNSVSYIQDQVSGRSNLEIIAEGSLMQPNNQALYTLPGSPLQSIAQLGHARIGVNVTNNIGTLLVSSVLEEHGVSLRGVQFVAIKSGFPGMAQALQQHRIDVAWLPEPFGSADAMKYGFQEVADLDQGATTSFPVGWYMVTKTWAKKYPRTLAAFLAALVKGQEIADTDRSAVELAMEKLPPPYNVAPPIAAVMSLENYPLSIAPDIDRSRVQRVADAMYQFHMLAQPFYVSSMLS